MSEAPAIVVLEGVGRAFANGEVRALRDITATIPDGGITGVVGPDAAGKTTLLRLIAGLLLPQAGRITVMGYDSRQSALYRGELGYMPQRFGLYEDLTVVENLRLYGELHQLDRAAFAERVGRLLEFTELAPFTSRLAGALSGGMKQKLGLACALLPRPRLLLLDEPSVGVDPISRRELWQIVEELAGAGTTVLWSTAYLDEAERCTKVLLLHDGRLLAVSAPAELKSEVSGRVYLVPIGGEPKRRLQRRCAGLPQIQDAVIQGGALRILMKAGCPAPGAHDLGMAPEIPVEPAPPRFEDAFVARLAERAVPPIESTQLGGATTIGSRASPIETQGLVRDFGHFRAVDHVTFSVRAGEIFGLLGPNGAGKSTTFKMLCGLLRPTAGTAFVAGHDLARSPAKARERLGYMAQRFSLYGDLTVRDNLEFFCGTYNMRGGRRREAIERILAEFDLWDVADRVSGDLPLGYKQRLALGAALLHSPEILFLDEPTSGVDPLARRAFWDRIGRLAETGITVLVTSHFMEEVEYCDRIGIIDRGRLIALDTPEALRAPFVTPNRPTPTLEDAFIALVEAAEQGPSSIGQP